MISKAQKDLFKRRDALKTMLFKSNWKQQKALLKHSQRYISIGQTETDVNSVKILIKNSSLHFLEQAVVLILIYGKKNLPDFDAKKFCRIAIEEFNRQIDKENNGKK